MKIIQKRFKLSLSEAKSVIEQSRRELGRGTRLQIDQLHEALVAVGATVEQIDDGPSELPVRS